METRLFARSTEPDLPILNAALTPLLAVANVGSFYTIWQEPHVQIYQASFAGVDLIAVAQAVANAPAHSLLEDTRRRVDELSSVETSLVLVNIDLINAERFRHAAPLISKEAYVALLKAKLGEIVVELAQARQSEGSTASVVESVPVPISQRLRHWLGF